MKNYELTFLITPEISEEEAKAFSQKIVSLIQEEGGVLVGEANLLNKKLAYSIKKQTQAYLAVLFFQLEPQKLANLEKKLKAEKQILRYLILTKVPVKEKLVKAKRVPKLPISRKPTPKTKEKKVELKEIEKKLEEILHEPK